MAFSCRKQQTPLDADRLERGSAFHSLGRARLRGIGMSDPQNNMTQTEFIGSLLEWGYKRHTTASTRWRIALVFRNSQKTLIVLIRKRGVDVLESPLTPGQMTNEEGLLSISMQRAGDRFVELGYTEANTSIHDIALYIASLVAQDKPVADELFTRRGIGPREWALKYGELSKGLRRSPASDVGEGGTMEDLYDAVSNGDGEDAYLGDGMWIRSDGCTYDS